jgi:DNA-directed RNA polymerase specialized sigma24 family protein
LARALDLLDEHDRLLVQMLVEGHSTREIAERIGLPTDVVNVRLARARKRLAASLTSG